MDRDGWGQPGHLREQGSPLGKSRSPTSPGPGLLGARRPASPPPGSRPHARQSPEDTELGEEGKVLEATLPASSAPSQVPPRCGRRQSQSCHPLGKRRDAPPHLIAEKMGNVLKYVSPARPASSEAPSLRLCPFTAFLALNSKLPHSFSCALSWRCHYQLIPLQSV